MSGAVTRREFSVRYVWNGAKGRLRWNVFSYAETHLRGKKKYVFLLKF